MNVSAILCGIRLNGDLNYLHLIIFVRKIHKLTKKHHDPDSSARNL